MTLAEVIAQLDDLPEKSTIYAESLAPSARAHVAQSSPCPADLPYALNVAAAQAAIGRGAPRCRWRRRTTLIRRAWLG